ncbi:PHD finger protein 19 [Dispira simplex]|nr:PHD finger protein 19 [Dispira simplex]
MSAQLHPNALLTALCFTIILGDYDTFSQVRHHGVFAALEPNQPSSSGSMYAASDPVPFVKSQTEEPPLSDSNPKTMLLTLLGRAWSRVHRRLLTVDPSILRDNASESLVTALTQFTEELSLCQLDMDQWQDNYLYIANVLHRFPSVVGFVLPLVLDTVLADCGVSNETLQRWFRLKSSNTIESDTPSVAGLRLTSSPGSLVAQQPLGVTPAPTPESSTEYWENYCRSFITVPQERFSSATHLADHLYKVLCPRDNLPQCIDSYPGESSPAREKSDTWPDYIRIYVDNAEIRQVPFQVTIPVTSAGKGTAKAPASTTLSGRQSVQAPIPNPQKRGIQVHLSHTIDWLRSQLDLLQLPSNTITSTVDFLAQVEQQRLRTMPNDSTTTTAAGEIIESPTTYELQTVIIRGHHPDQTGWFYMFDRDLVNRSQWKRWQDNRLEKLTELPSPLLESDERICWLFYHRNQETEHEPSPTLHGIPLTEPDQLHEEFLDDQNVVTHDHTLDIIACRVCMSGDDSPDNQIVLCDACDEGVHQLCQVPPVTEKHLAYDPWYCTRCWEKYREKSAATGVKRKFDSRMD